MNPTQAFAYFINALKMEQSKTSHDTHFAPLILQSYNPVTHILTIQTPNAAETAWHTSRSSTYFRRALAPLLHSDLVVVFTAT